MHRNISIILAITLGALSPWHADAQQPYPAALDRTPVVEVPYDSTVGLILLPATIHGTSLQLLLDHGTDQTLLSNATTSETNVVNGLVDTLLIGTHALHDVAVGQVDFGLDGIFGASELVHYDFVFDGPARRVRLYAIPAHATKPSWLPRGISADDCTPMLHDDSYPNRVFFDLHANGNLVHSMFDSGARFVNINMAAAKMLGLSETSLNVTPIDGDYRLMSGAALFRATRVPLTVGHKHIPVTESPIHIFQDLPREHDPEDAELSMGLFAILDRIFVVSYSTHQVCLTPPRA